tara:strand:- start:219 stop:767 length:549 start_codon:yes stop_codon:yes gene_type:complete
MNLKVPNLAIIIGEGGSGGAIALASASKVIMLENSIYSVISPEGCATILWRDPKKTLEAAKAMKLTSSELLDLNIVDEVIKEPTGGAHRDRETILENIKNSIKKNLDYFENLSEDQIISERKNKFLKIGRGRGFLPSPEITSGLSFRKSKFSSLLEILNRKKIIFITSSVTILLISYLIYIL